MALAKASPAVVRGARALMNGWSIEVIPRTAAKVEDFRTFVPPDTRIYVAHVTSTSIDDMVATAKRLRRQGFAVMPHIPARLIRDVGMLETWIKRYRREAGVTEALLLAGGQQEPAGNLSDSLQLLETGLFDKYDFTRLHVAGHPEVCRDIDPDGTSKKADEALRWKNAFSQKTQADMAIVTQFAFDAKVVIEWAQRIQDDGITLPIHVGIVGPAKVKTLLEFAVACGVGPSLKVLQRRATDVTRLFKPYEPIDVVTDLCEHVGNNPNTLIKQLHVYPFGGSHAAVDWMKTHAL